MNGCFTESPPRAGNGTRTRDPNLGKVVLYQLSYSRITPESSLRPGTRRRPGRFRDSRTETREKLETPPWGVKPIMGFERFP